MGRESGDRPLLQLELGLNIAYNQWLADGLPANSWNGFMAAISNRPTLFDPPGYLVYRFKQFFLPPLEERPIAEGDGRLAYAAREGVTLRVRTEGGGSPPHEIDFAIHRPADHVVHPERLLRSAGGARTRLGSPATDRPTARSRAIPWRCRCTGRLPSCWR